MNSTNTRVACIINPTSGNRKGLTLANALKKSTFFTESGLKILETSHPSLHNEIEGLKRESEVIIIAGGDGTVSSLLPYFSDTSIRVGIIPLGTGNDLAREAGVMGRFLLADISNSLRCMVQANTIPLTLWRLC